LIQSYSIDSFVDLFQADHLAAVVAEQIDGVKTPRFEPLKHGLALNLWPRKQLRFRIEQQEGSK
jgi:hypothetical protein